MAVEIVSLEGVRLVVTCELWAGIYEASIVMQRKQNV